MSGERGDAAWTSADACWRQAHALLSATARGALSAREAHKQDDLVDTSSYGSGIQHPKSAVGKTCRLVERQSASGGEDSRNGHRFSDQLRRKFGRHTL